MHNDNIYDKFFQLVKSVFHLYCDPKYSYLIPSSRSLIPSSHLGGEPVGFIFSECFKPLIQAVKTNANLIEQNVRSSLLQICICIRVPKQWKWIRVKAWPGMSKLFRYAFRNTWKLFKKNSKSASFHSI